MDEHLQPQKSPFVEVLDDVDDEEHANAPQQRAINTTALNGLRGFLSVRIMLFHSLLYSKLQWNILGSVDMTFFFLISGFVLGLNEGKQRYSLTPCCGELRKSQNGNHFDGKNFYQRRMARTLPLYYLLNLMCIPLIRSGHSHLDPGFVEYIAYFLTFFVSTTWFGVPIVLNGPSWFVSTLWFCYWIFPSLLPQFQQYTIKHTRRWIIIHFLIQLIGGCMLVAVWMGITPEWAFYIGTFWPPSRLPVFIMGVLGGLLRTNGFSLSEHRDSWTVQQWKRRSDLITIFIVLSFVVVCVIENYPKEWELGSAVWMQLGIAYVALQWIISLSFDEGTSVVSKILTSEVALVFGRISYPLYLFHLPFIQYMCWMNYGTISKPDCEGREKWSCALEWEEWSDKKLIPIWYIPAVVVVSFVAAVILNRLFEEPLRKQLRPSKVIMAESNLVIEMENISAADHAVNDCDETR